MPLETLEEKLAAEALRSWIYERKIQCYEYCRTLASTPQDQLKFSGHHNHGDALKSAIQRAEREIERRIQAHEKAFPHD